MTRPPLGHVQRCPAARLGIGGEDVRQKPGSSGQGSPPPESGPQRPAAVSRDVHPPAHCRSLVTSPLPARPAPPILRPPIGGVEPLTGLRQRDSPHGRPPSRCANGETDLSARGSAWIRTGGLHDGPTGDTRPHPFDPGPGPTAERMLIRSTTSPRKQHGGPPRGGIPGRRLHRAGVGARGRWPVQASDDRLDGRLRPERGWLPRLPERQAHRHRRCILASTGRGTRCTVDRIPHLVHADHEWQGLVCLRAERRWHPAAAPDRSPVSAQGQGGQVHREDPGLSGRPMARVWPTISPVRQASASSLVGRSGIDPARDPMHS